MILDRTVRKALPKTVKNNSGSDSSGRSSSEFQEVAKKRRLRSLNIVDRDPWRNPLKGLVRRQAAKHKSKSRSR